MNKRFWKSVKPLFSNKIQSSSCVALLENGVVESDQGKVAEILNNYFVNITGTLGIADEHEQEPLSNHKDDPQRVHFHMTLYTVYTKNL